MIGWTFLTYPWEKFKGFTTGKVKGMVTEKAPIPRQHTKRLPRGWMDVEGIRRPFVFGGTASSGGLSDRAGFYEILEEGEFEYGLQRDNVKEYFFHGKLLNGRYIFRVLNLRGGKTWLCFRPEDQMPADPEKHEDTGDWKLHGTGEVETISPRET